MSDEQASKSIEDTLQGNAIAVRDAIFDLAQSTSDTYRITNAPLYHYTSGDGLRGIIESGSLWLSDSAFLNDGSERLWAIKIIEESVQQLKKRFKTQYISEFLDLVMLYLNNISDDSATYVFCMSFDGDLLNQWRDYGKDIVPYSIEFDTEALLKGGSPPVRIVRMIYNKQKQLSIVTKILAHSIVSIFRENRNDKNVINSIYTLSISVSAALESVITCFKNPAFEAEREARAYVQGYFVDDERDKRSYRSSRIGFVPFLKYRKNNLQKLPIQSITVGPTRFPEVAAASLTMMLRDSGYGAVAVKMSQIPIRF